MTNILLAEKDIIKRISKQSEYRSVEQLEEKLTDIGFDDPKHIGDILDHYLTTTSIDFNSKNINHVIINPLTILHFARSENY